MRTPTTITRGTRNVFADLGVSSPEEALAKAALAYRIAAIVVDRRLTQAAAARLLGVDQPKVSALLRGRLSGFSTGRLIRFLTALGSSVEIRVIPPSGTRGRGHLRVASTAGASARKRAAP
jgi:predicted XRE-type DNA-binding protein